MATNPLPQPGIAEILLDIRNHAQVAKRCAKQLADTADTDPLFDERADQCHADDLHSEALVRQFWAAMAGAHGVVVARVMQQMVDEGMLS